MDDEKAALVHQDVFQPGVVGESDQDFDGNVCDTSSTNLVYFSKLHLRLFYRDQGQHAAEVGGRDSPFHVLTFMSYPRNQIPCDLSLLLDFGNGEPTLEDAVLECFLGSIQRAAGWCRTVGTRKLTF